MRGDLSGSGLLDDGPGLEQAIRKRLVHDYILPLFQGRDGYDAVGVIGRHYFDCGHILLFFQQLAEIRVRGAAPELFLATLPGVVRFDNFLADVAAARRVI